MKPVWSVLRIIQHHLWAWMWAWTTLLVYISSYLAFQWVGAFPPRQSIVLSLLVGSFCLHLLSSKQPSKFQTFYIHIEPQWFSIGTLEGLVDEKRLMALQDDRGQDNKEYRAWRDGITFTMIGPRLYY